MCSIQPPSHLPLSANDSPSVNGVGMSSQSTSGVNFDDIPLADGEPSPLLPSHSSYGTTVECNHRFGKKKLIIGKETRKKVKSCKVPSHCEECHRATTAGKAVGSSGSEDASICIACGKFLCSSHAKDHAGVTRSGDPHFLMFDTTRQLIRCASCEEKVEPDDSISSDPVKMFLNDMKQICKVNVGRGVVQKENGSDQKKNANGSVDKPSTVAIEESDSGNLPDIPKNFESKTTKSNGKIEKIEKSNNLFNSSNGTTPLLLPAKGLSNLGNTCFFNSVMQCVMHTHQLLFYFERFGRVRELKFDDAEVVVNEEKVPLEAAVMRVNECSTPLNDSLRSFVFDFRNGHTPNPSPLFNEIARKAIRFRSMAQQDAHELLRYLLDGLCSEETERYRAAIAEHFGVSTKANPKSLDPVVVKQAKGYLQLAGRALLDAVFGGVLLQTIRCHECGYISERKENFLDLSVPLASAASLRSNSCSGAPKANGVVNARMSKHQKKNEAKAQKKLNRKNRSRKNSRNMSMQQANGKAEDESRLLSKMESMEFSDDDEGSQPEEEKENGQPQGNPIDLTKVLASPPEEWLSKSEKSVQASLLEFTAEERLAGANAFECEKCCTPMNKKMKVTGAAKKRVSALKRYLIFSPPPVLTIHLKRFQQIHSGSRLVTRKVSGYVDFPLLFDIAPFCCKNAERVAPGEQRILYSLYGIVSHSGDLSGGHYVAYVKSRKRIIQVLSFLESARASCADRLCTPPLAMAAPSPSSPLDTPEAVSEATAGQWYSASDSRISAVSESKVQQADAYLLFYERVF